MAYLVCFSDVSLVKKKKKKTQLLASVSSEIVSFTFYWLIITFTLHEQTVKFPPIHRSLWTMLAFVAMMTDHSPSEIPDIVSLPILCCDLSSTFAHPTHKPITKRTNISPWTISKSKNWKWGQPSFTDRFLAISFPHFNSSHSEVWSFWGAFQIVNGKWTELI